MFQRFVHRPVLATVTSLVLVFLGWLAIGTMPVSQFPQIAPPRVIVAITYPASFAFISGLIPLVLASGPGAVGNRIVGASALGGMSFGTNFGVIIVLGLHFIFGSLADGRQLVREDSKVPVTEAPWAQ